MTTTKKSKNPYDVDEDEFEDTKTICENKPTVQLKEIYNEEEIIEKINPNISDQRIENLITKNEAIAKNFDNQSYFKKCLCEIF